jgi:membrane protease YdiL (CAAX protease family)
MRDYLSGANIAKAAALALVVTAMSLPRCAQAGLPLGVYTLATFVSMTLVAAAGTAWGTRAGMCGLFPGRRRMLGGVGVAAGVALVLAPVYILSDGTLKEIVEATGDAVQLRLQYPSTVQGAVALLLWSAGFETLFFVVAPTSVVARVTNRQTLAIVLPVVVRALVVYYKLGLEGVVAATPLFLARTAVGGVMACALFARSGLVPSMTLSALLELRHVLPALWEG